MKRIVALLLSVVLLLTGCASETNINSTSVEVSLKDNSEMIQGALVSEEEGDDTDFVYAPEFDNLDDEKLKTYVEDVIYSEVVASLNSDKYYVENVSAVYVSQEYIDEITYNSQSNVYFGFSLADIDAQFQGTRYIFTVGEEGDTVVEPFESYDDSFEQIIKNVAIGTGVILVCVTVSLVTGGAGAPAVSLIFATAAKTGTTMAISSAALGGISAGVVKGMETGDMSEALKAATLAASDGYKWGAFTGVLTGGVAESVKYAKAMKALKGAELNLSTQEAAAIQMKTGYPTEVISQFHSMDEFAVFEEAGLKAQMINGQTALVRDDINLALMDESGLSNLERMQKGLAPIYKDEAGNIFKFELHHIGQESDATLAILTQVEHDSKGLHGFKMVSEIDRPAFDNIRRKFWKTMAKYLSGGSV